MINIFIEFILEYCILSSLAILSVFLACPLEKKRYFKFTFSIFIAISIIISIVLSYFKFLTYNFSSQVYDAIFLILTYLEILCLSFICYRGSIGIIFCYLNIGLAIFYIIFAINNGLSNILLISNITLPFYISIIIKLLIDIALILCCYFFLIKSYYKKNVSGDNNSSLVIFSCFALVTIVLSIFKIAIANYNKIFLFFLSLNEILYSMISLAIAYLLFQKEESLIELSILKKLWDEDRKYYSQLKENIEIINIKCHDLKHQFRALRQHENLNQELINEIEESIDIYNSKLKTENEVLDVVLTDYNLRAHKNHIELTCMVDGKLISHLEDVDLYSLFGNMLSNAFEYEMKIDEEDRFVSLTIKREGELINIHCENYFIGENFISEKGFLKSTKDNSSEHGFGLKSMAKIVNKYQGKFKYYIADKMFQIDIYLPARKEQHEN